MFLKTYWIFCCIILFVAAQNWTGNIESYKASTWTTCKRCVFQYFWGCGYYRTFFCMTQKDSVRCAKGWTHGGDYNCIIPICLPNCGPGECIAPDKCDCKNLATGQYCETCFSEDKLY